MSQQSVETTKPLKPRDPDLAGAEIAMRRAALRARDRARRVGAGVILWKDGRIVEEQPDKAAPASLMGR